MTLIGPLELHPVELNTHCGMLVGECILSKGLHITERILRDAGLPQILIFVCCGLVCYVIK